MDDIISRRQNMYLDRHYQLNQSKMYAKDISASKKEGGGGGGSHLFYLLLDMPIEIAKEDQKKKKGE